MSNTAIALRNEGVETMLALCEEKEVRMNIVERKLLKSMGKRAIKDTSDVELMADCKAIMLGAYRDMGIHTPPDKYDSTRFLDVLREYFKDFTIVDVKQAFEFFVLGELDEFLPRDSKGRTIDHYQQFSMKFYVTLLRAYRQKQLQAKKDVNGRLEVIMIEERTQNADPYATRFGFIDVVRGIILKLAAGDNPTFPVTDSVEYVLKRVKLLPKVITPTDEDVKRAAAKMGKNRDSSVASALKKMVEAGNLSSDLQAHAQSVALRRILNENVFGMEEAEVNKRFDWLIGWYRKRKEQEKA